MKLQCDQCGTRYAIKDDKVRGPDRVFKIRCKSCNAVITVHGITEQSAEPAAPPDANEWYFAVEGQQSGPMTRSELEDQIRQGAVPRTAFVWHAGMDDWVGLPSIKELNDLIPDGATSADDLIDALAAESDSGKGADAASAEAPRPDLDAADATIVDEPKHDDLLDRPTAGVAASTTLDQLFRDDPRPAAPEVNVTRLPEPASRAEPARPAAQDHDDGGFFDAPEGNAQDDKKRDSGRLAYQRHDNSVLFSLSEPEGDQRPKDDKKSKALAALAADSGLVDIRAFSKKKKDQKEQKGDVFAVLVGEDTARKSPATSTTADGLPSLAAAPPIAVPVLQKKRKGNGMVVGVIAGAAIAAGVSAVVIMSMNKDDKKDEPKKETPVAVAPVATAPAAPAPKPAPGAPVAQPLPPPAVKPATGPVAPAPPAPALATGTPAPVPAPATGPAAPVPATGAVSATGPAAATGAPAATGPMAKVETKPLTEAEKKARDKAEKERLDKAKEKQAAMALLKAEEKKPAETAKVEPVKKDDPPPPKVDPNDLLGKIDASSKKSENDGGNEMPESLTMAQIQKGANKAAGKVKSCAQGAGLAGVTISVRFTIQPSGSVSGVSASGAAAATDCVTGAVGSVSFPPFKGPAKPVSIPYKIP